MGDDVDWECMMIQQNETEQKTNRLNGTV